MSKEKTPLPANLDLDVVLSNYQVGRLIGQLIKGGKKSKARRIAKDCFALIAQKTKKDPLDVFDEALRNVAPSLEIKAKRVGGANYQVPVPVMGERRITLALRWIISGANSKKGKPMAEGLAMEIMDAFNKQGSAVRKREETHRMAEANKAFAHFA